ncbi:DICT sensory domain-containing protein [Nocardioides coralli]|uniref:DICT sensory domain-containing protein n=1 Tax=Nocardioides coralli TaxID=2872154 RepID=UPI001CA3A98F|nr:DICT sensory domain-containing protein [Nocardioides coralli]QZY27768.1 MerR family transcriptional regulator [Nocardioides coralli]
MQDEEDGDDTLSIGQLAAQAGVTPQLIRTWESRFGFPHPRRLASGHRRYARADIAAVRAVLEARSRGVDLQTAVHSATTRATAAVRGSLFAGFAAGHGLQRYRLHKSTLLAMSWAIEDEVLAGAQRGLLIGTFQEVRHFRASRARWHDLAAASEHALAMADFSRHDDDAVPAEVALPRHYPLLREWALLHESPSLTVALVAREAAGQGQVRDADRVFEAAWSFDGAVVRECLTNCIAIASHLGSHAALRLGSALEQQPLPPSTSVVVAHQIFSRAIEFMDQASQQRP